MWGSATLAMEVSITSMKVASITETAISHGFTIGSSRGDIPPLDATGVRKETAVRKFPYAVDMAHR